MVRIKQKGGWASRITNFIDSDIIAVPTDPPSPPPTDPPTPPPLTDYLASGLFRYSYNAYFYNDVAAWGGTPSSTMVTSVINIPSQPQYKSEIFLGYFRPPVSGTMTFTLLSDNAGFVWIGDNARNPTSSNTLLQCTDVVTKTTTLQVDSSTYYPFRLYFGNKIGPGYLTFTMAGPSLAKTSNFNGTLFYDTRVNGM